MLMNKSKLYSITFVAALSMNILGCKKPEALKLEDESEWLSGGTQTVFDQGAGAFSAPFGDLSAREDFMHEVGDIAFEATFVSSPAIKNFGLGPIYNSVSCISCHVADGRGKPPVNGETMVGLLIRISIPGEDEYGGPLDAPGFGGQLQHRAIAGKAAEADVNITYTPILGTFEDGTPYELLQPTYSLSNEYTSLPAGYLLSARVAPPVFGLGLLEGISEATILAFADEFDSDGDGISGKPNFVWNVLEKKNTLGRFGWKAEAPTILQQSAGAYNQDMGITNFVFPIENSYSQQQYDWLDDDVELSDSLMHAVTFYMQTLAVPARRNADDAEVLSGKGVFNAIGCASCHIPKVTTAVNVAFPSISNQTIYPYTDLLLHDMGEGLADYRPSYKANGYEWRTPPLWGIGLTKIVNGHQNFLHDGRARNFSEAILWHGGEAKDAKEKFVSLTKTEREALLKFLQSL